LRQKKPPLSFFVPFLLISILPIIGRPAQAVETIDRILVVVNDEIITERELRLATEPLVAQFRATLSGPELDRKTAEAKEMILYQLIDDRLVRGAAKREGVEVNEEEVDAMVSDVREKFPNEQAFQELLRQQGLTFKSLRDRFEDKILKRRMADIAVRSRIAISPGEVKQYYDDHKEEFKGPERVRIRHILIRVAPERPDEQAHELSLSILDQIDNGMSFEVLAERYSEAVESQKGGDMGWVDRGQFMERIDREIFTLNVGGHTAPIRSQLGFHIFKVVDKQASVIRPFKQVRQRVESLLYKQRTDTKMKQWIEALRKDAYIAFKTDRV
jgi:parvulin-like peptidyl-prolyl isomerase